MTANKTDLLIQNGGHDNHSSRKRESPEEEDEDRDTHSDRETAGHETVTDFTISSEGRDEGKGSIVSSETPTDRDECVLRLQFLLQIPSLGPKPEFAIEDSRIEEFAPSSVNTHTARSRLQRRLRRKRA